MFYDGTLQGGIALAIQQNKLVVCFVQDDSTKSSIWHKWLRNEGIANQLQRAVVLSLQAGTTEAGFLSAFCDLSSIPTVVVIHNGQLQLQLKTDIGEDEFTSSINESLSAEASQARSNVQAPLSELDQGQPGEGSPSEAATVHNSSLPSSSWSDSSSAKTSKWEDKQKSKPTTNVGTNSSTASVQTAQQAARLALRRKKHDEAEELARIQARIQSDKAERKSMAEARQAERERERKTAVDSGLHSVSETSSKGSQALTVNLNIRLFDGQTIRHAFVRTAKLQDEVRSWIDEQFLKRSNEVNMTSQDLPPYIFRQILTPQSRELTAGDENQTIGDLGLAPSATLVLVPIHDFTEAYSGQDGGVIETASGLIGSSLGFVSSGVGFVGNALSSVFGYASSSTGNNLAQAVSTGQRSTPSNNSNTTGARIRTFHDPGQTASQFYNGNQLSTEPRIDDETK